jgi:hypothetical protein
VRRLERAELAAARQRIKKRSKTASISGNDDIGLGQDLEAHYQISKSRKDPLNIYSYVHANHGDPAFDVRLCVARKKTGDVTDVI